MSGLHRISWHNARGKRRKIFNICSFVALRLNPDSSWHLDNPFRLWQRNVCKSRDAVSVSVV